MGTSAGNHNEQLRAGTIDPPDQKERRSKRQKEELDDLTDGMQRARLWNGRTKLYIFNGMRALGKSIVLPTSQRFLADESAATDIARMVMESTTLSDMAKLRVAYVNEEREDLWARVSTGFELLPDSAKKTLANSGAFGNEFILRDELVLRGEISGAMNRLLAGKPLSFYHEVKAGLAFMEFATPGSTYRITLGERPEQSCVDWQRGAAGNIAAIAS